MATIDSRYLGNQVFITSLPGVQECSLIMYLMFEDGPVEIPSPSVAQ